MTRDNKSEDKKNSFKTVGKVIFAIFELALIISVPLYVLALQERNNYEQIVQGLGVVNCINHSKARKFVTAQNEEWNIRYQTEFYQQNWSHIYKSAETDEKFKLYVVFITKMEAVNSILDRTESNAPALWLGGGTDLVTQKTGEKLKIVKTASEEILKGLEAVGTYAENCGSIAEI